ncbi:MAG: hypothetical protein WCL44_12800, partial [bacterium]
YAQVAGVGRYGEVVADLNRIIVRAGLHPRLGCFAVGGDIDRQGLWQGIFEGLPVHAVQRSTVFDAGPVVVTALSPEDSRRSSLMVAPQDKLHIVLGHAPDFSLSNVDADILLAGHTHGGQVRLPLLGPILTLSRVPRDWAAGLTTISEGRSLLVSRGIGMERQNAPRLRFLCRPELVILDVLPLMN